jgi:hypothetical protein
MGKKKKKKGRGILSELEEKRRFLERSGAEGILKKKGKKKKKK